MHKNRPTAYLFPYDTRRCTIIYTEFGLSGGWGVNPPLVEDDPPYW